MSRLTIKGLTKTYDNLKAIDGFSIEVEDGELLAILGPSGCGKSTLLGCIGGIEEIDTGTIMLGGRCLYDHDQGIFVPPEKREIGFMFQNYALWPHMSVEQNISYPLKIRGIKKTLIEFETKQILELMRLEKKRKNHPGQLSGGEQQRVALGRALIMKPELLLLDEPLSNLDAKLREEMQSEIRNIQRELGLTAVHVTHDQSEALAMSDRIALMNKGRLVQLGTPSEIYNTPESKFTAQFMGSNNLISGKIFKTGGRQVFRSENNSIREIPADSAPCSMISSPSVLCVIRPEDIELSSESSSGNGSKKAMVASSIYRGAHFLYTIDTGGQLLRVQAHPSEIFNCGTDVYYRIKKSVYISN